MKMWKENLKWLQSQLAVIKTVLESLCGKLVIAFVSSHLIPFPFSTIAEPHWLVVVMLCLVNEPLLIDILGLF